MTVAIQSADAAGTLVADQAEISADLFCFGVGGAIVENATGRIIRKWGNRAQNQLKSGEYYPFDPTNHGETQLVRWYYDNQEKIRNDLGYLPKPQELTVFTSLDPCAMCAGGLCAAGFNVGVMAPDDSDGGVNWAADGQFRHMPSSIQKQLREAFGYYKVDGIDYRKQYQGNPSLLFSTETLSQKVFESNLDAFTNSAGKVSQVRREARIALADLKNPIKLGDNDPAVQALKQAFPEALSIQLTEKVDTGITGMIPRNNVYYRPTEELRQKLQQAMENEPGAENAVAIIDPFGNLIAIGVDKPTKSPVATSLMNASSDYSRFLFDLISQASDTNVPNKYKESTAYNYLAPTRNSTFIYLKCPSADQAQTLKDLGAFESSNGGIIQYIEPPRFGTRIDFEQHARALPLYYRGSDATTPMQSTPEELIIAVSNSKNSGPGSLRDAINTANRENSYRIILIESTKPIELRKRLPTITSPVDIKPLNESQKAIIDFNSVPGLHFSKTASGSKLSNLLLKKASLFGISTDTQSLQFENVDFLAASSPRQGRKTTAGSIQNPLQFNGLNLQGWSNPIAELSNTFAIRDRAIKVNAVNTLITSNRIDAAAEEIEFSFVNTQTDETTTAKVFLGSNVGSLTSAHIEKSFASGQLLSSPHSGDFTALGDQNVNDLSSGNWLPKAKLADGQELTLVWMEQSGTVINAEFKLLLKDANPNDLSLISKTYEFTFDVASPGSNVRAQKGEMAVKAMQNFADPLMLGFYKVRDPLTGMVSGLTPDQEGYAKAAFKRAREDNLLIKDLASNDQQVDSRIIMLKSMDPRKSYGMVIRNVKDPQSRETFTSYQRPNEGELQPFRSFALGNNRVAIGVEVDFRSTQGDFADLIFTLPDNINMVMSGWG